MRYEEHIAKGKHVLNIWVSKEEHKFLTKQAKTQLLTLTMLIRNLIREKMPKQEW